MMPCSSSSVPSPVRLGPADIQFHLLCMSAAGFRTASSSPIHRQGFDSGTKTSAYKHCKQAAILISKGHNHSGFASMPTTIVSSPPPQSMKQSVMHRLLTAWLNPLDAARVLANQAHIVRGSQARGLRLQGFALSQFVLLQVLQHVFHTQQMGLQMGVSGASWGRGRTVVMFHTNCQAPVCGCSAANRQISCCYCAAA